MRNLIIATAATALALSGALYLTPGKAHTPVVFDLVLYAQLADGELYKYTADVNLTLEDCARAIDGPQIGVYINVLRTCEVVR